MLILEWAHVLAHIVCIETAQTRGQGELSCVTMWSIINLPLNYTYEANVRNGHRIGFYQITVDCVTAPSVRVHFKQEKVTMFRNLL